MNACVLGERSVVACMSWVDVCSSVNACVPGERKCGRMQFCRGRCGYLFCCRLVWYAAAAAC